MDRVNIMSEQWDYLIILDACRYDYFERLYRNYFDGRLTKKMSTGSCTNEWTNRTFTDYYDDVVYISANPQITSELPVYGFLAGEHFHKVHEVWKTGWDNEKGTVRPEALTNAVINIIRNTPSKRFIIHYLQPHAPYLMPEIKSHGYDKAEIYSDRAIADSVKYKRFSSVKKWLLKNLLKLFKNTNILTNYPEWILRQVLHMAPTCAMDVVRRRYGKKMLSKAYKANLECVLEQVAVLLKHLAGKIIITSDHGELLGEGGRYAHPYGSLDAILVEVPWLAIEKAEKDIDRKDVIAEKEMTNAIDKADTEMDRQELMRKLKALGYYD